MDLMRQIRSSDLKRAPRAVLSAFCLVAFFTQPKTGTAGTVYLFDYNTGPVPTGMTNATAIAGYSSKFLALRDDQTVCQSSTINGQPNVPPGLSNVVGIACDFEENFAWRADGTVVGWGLDRYGQG